MNSAQSGSRLRYLPPADNLMAFLESLTEPGLVRLLATIPADVPSGLLEDGIPESP